MADTTFGTFPTQRKMLLTTGQDFALTLRNKVGGAATSFPSGAALSIVFDNGTTWAATVAGSDASWAVNKTVADAITEGTGYRLTYADSSGADLVPYKGTVLRDDSQG